MGRTRIHDEATGAALLEAAEKIVETDGLQALTVRRVAEKTGTTTRAVYTSLGSKQALVSGLGARAFDMLGAMVDRLPVTSDPAADLIAAGTLGFRRFALNHPALFQIGIQQTSVTPDVAQTMVPAAERALERCTAGSPACTTPAGSAPAPYPRRPGNSTPHAKGWPPSNYAASSPPNTASTCGTTPSAPSSPGGSKVTPGATPPGSAQ